MRRRFEDQGEDQLTLKGIYDHIWQKARSLDVSLKQERFGLQGKMADGELNIDSIISRLLEGNNPKFLIITI